MDGTPGQKRPRTEIRNQTQSDECLGDQENKNFSVDQQKRKKIHPAPRPVLPSSDLGKDISIWDNAALLIDKPQTWTSFDVCGKIRGELARILNVKSKKIKVGHAGTLDPMATGLLIVCVGKGTKSIDSFVSMKKDYSGKMKLGEVTDSYDADGKIVSTLEWKDVTSMCLISTDMADII